MFVNPPSFMGQLRAGQISTVNPTQAQPHPTEPEPNPTAKPKPKKTAANPLGKENHNNYVRKNQTEHAAPRYWKTTAPSRCAVGRGWCKSNKKSDDASSFLPQIVAKKIVNFRLLFHPTVKSCLCILRHLGLCVAFWSQNLQYIYFKWGW